LRADFLLLAGATAIALVVQIGVEAVPWIGWLAGFLIAGPLWGGLYGLFLKRVRGQPAVLGDMFAGFGAKLVPLMGAGALFQVGVIAGLVLCVVPGVFLFTAWLFVWPLLLERDLGVWEAFELSRKTVQPQWWAYFVYAAVGLLVFLAGGLVFGVGIVVTAALVNASYVCAFEDVFGGRKEAASAGAGG
jgi:uncharacterized membrane protein